MKFLANVCRDSPIKMLFTVKSFPCREIIKLDYKIMPGFEISNLNEYQLLPNNIKNVIVSINDPTGKINSNKCRKKKHNGINFHRSDFILSLLFFFL